MTLGAVFISGRDWWYPSIGIVALGILLLAWTYWRAPANKGTRTICALLKLLAVGALAACLLEPLWSGQRAKPGSNYFAILADNSQGMTIKDRNAIKSRGEELHQLLTSENATWPARLEENFQVRKYYFDSRLQSTRDYSELVFDGRASSIGTALKTIGDRFRGQPIAGVLMLTDGNATDISGNLPDLAGLPPIYPVIIGSDDPINDVAIQKVAVTQTSFEDAPVTIQADVSAGGYSWKTIVAQLLDPTGLKIEEQTQRVQREGEPLSFRFQVRPDKSGISFYRVRVSAQDELEQFAKPETSLEATLANNNRVVVVDRGNGPYRVLYVSGRPSWEFKFLNRALADDDQLDLVGLIRIAKKEKNFGRMEFKNRPGESSNPLFRGFDRTTEDTEGYDEPVRIRVNIKEPTELAGGFPKTAEELYGYHAVILDDVESEYFTRDQMMLMQKFVSERGGGFLMLGGAESFHQGKYDHTPVGEMLPVYLDTVADAVLTTTFKLNLSREGWLQPWFRLRNNEVDEKTRIDEMPAFQTLNRIRDVKPGASVIASIQDERGANHPALVAQRFGNGRSAALMIGDMWRWGMRDEEKHKDMDKAWRQMMRWLVVDVPARVEVVAEPKRDDPNQAVSLQVKARDKVFKPLDNATVRVSVRRVGGTTTTNAGEAHLSGEPSATQPGLYDTTYVPRDVGGYVAEAVVTDSEGMEAGKAEFGWSSDPAAEEFRSLNPNRSLLASIARQTGGEVIAAGRLDDFARSLPSRKAPITENWSVPLWHQPMVFLFALACFIAEWGLRRLKGLA
jgi:uncharacterized membrane protein